MKILALDLSRNVGWASNYSTPGYGIEKFPSKSFKRRGAVFSAFDGWLVSWIGKNGRPDLIAIESPHFRGGDPTLMLVGLMAMAERVCSDIGIEFDHETHTNSLKKWATGNGKAEKPQMISAANELGCMTDDDNVADAFLVLKRTEDMIRRKQTNP